MPGQHPGGSVRTEALKMLAPVSALCSVALLLLPPTPHATIPLPTANQLRYQLGEIVALTHFNIESFILPKGSQRQDPGCTAANWLVKGEGAVGPSADPSSFNPTQLDTDQWAEVYRSLGATGAVLTAKHGCGFLLWPTKVRLPDGSPYTYCVGKNESAIEDDVLARFSSSMNKHNITHGFYYSFTNNFYLNVQDHFAGHSRKLLKGQVNVSQKQFESIALDQVSELWSNYGQLGEIWFDGGYGGDVGPAIKKLVQKQKLAVGFGGKGVMDSPVGWDGTESGLPGGRVFWSTYGNVRGGWHDDMNGSFWQPTACDTTLQKSDAWFFEPGLAIRPLRELVEVYHQTVGRNCVLELDFAIDRTGRVAPEHTARYAQLGNFIRTCYGRPLAEAPIAQGAFVYNITLHPGGELVDRVVLREDQAHGQRLRSWRVDALIDDRWVKFGNGTGVGNRYVLLHAGPPPPPAKNPGKAVCDKTPVGSCTTGCQFTGKCGGVEVPPKGKSCNQCSCNAKRTPCGGIVPAPSPNAVNATVLRLTVVAAIEEPMLAQFAAFSPKPCALPPE